MPRRKKRTFKQVIKAGWEVFADGLAAFFVLVFLGVNIFGIGKKKKRKGAR